jgi:hypothetical protein
MSWPEPGGGPKLPGSYCQRRLYEMIGIGRLSAVALTAEASLCSAPCPLLVAIGSCIARSSMTFAER